MFKVDDKVIVVVGVRKGEKAKVRDIPHDGSDMILIKYDKDGYIDVKRKDWIEKID